MEEVTKEFILEDFQKNSSHLLDQLELMLYRVSNTGDFEKYSEKILSALRSLRGGSAIFNFEKLYKLLKNIENYIDFSETENLNKTQIHYLISSLDSARNFLNNENIELNLISPEEFKKIGIDEEFSDAKAEEENLCLLEGNTSEMGKIFIVEDDKEQLKQLKDILTDKFIVHTFTNAKDALKEVINKCPDVILTDMRMPEMTGLKFLKFVRELDSEVQVIFISAYIDKKLVLEATNYGVFNFLEKPYYPNIVESIVNMAFKKRAINKVLEKTVNYGFYQLGDYEAFHKPEGKKETQNFIKEKILEIDEKRRLLNLDYYTMFKKLYPDFNK